ncbi:MAG: M15 family metallopeptidase [Lachnospiraceae bacterium]|nr:M15 family metallopeptidase [Lachnospiraceae bacterium]
MKKRTLILRSAAAAVLAASGFFLVTRTTLPFRLERALSAKKERVTVTEAHPETVSVTLDGLKGKENVTFDTSLLMISPGHPLPDGFVPELSDYRDTGVLMETNTAEAYGALSDAILSDCGTKLYVIASYRTEEEQEAVKDSEGEVAAAVGESEHQAGLALDLAVRGYGGPSFIRTEAGKTVNRECSRYGFIIRYPFWGEKETGFSFEPWHVRYVGHPHAGIIMGNRMTLEAYLSSLAPGVWYSSGGYLISRQSGEALEIPSSFLSLTVSPDNCGRYVITAKTE